MKILFSCFLYALGGSLLSAAQQDLQIGGWKSHLPYQVGSSITQTPDKIIYGTPLSLLLIDKEELSTTFLSPVDGLSEVGISSVGYDPFNDQVVVIYDNSEMDFITDEGIINVPDIALNLAITGDKRVNDISFENKDRAFLATGFGIVALDINQKVFGSTTFAGMPIRHITTHDGYVYAGTDEGLYRAPLEGANLADFSIWALLTDQVGLPSLYPVLDIVVHHDQIYMASDDGIWLLQGNEWSLIYQNNQDEVLRFLSSTQERLIAGWSTGDFSSIIRFFDDNHLWITANNNCGTIALNAIQDERGRIWYADGVRPFRWSESYETSCRERVFSSPFSQNVSDIVVFDESVLVASGGVADNFTYLFGREGMYFLEEKKWRNLNEFVDSRIGDLEVLSVFRVAVHPSRPLLYGGSYWAGLLEYDIETDMYRLFNKTNSTLRGSMGDPARERVSGLAFDNEERLWVTTYNAPKPMNVMLGDGSWHSFSVTTGPQTLSDVVIDDLGYKWCPVFGNPGGVWVYDSGDNITDTSDDRQRFISRSNSLISGQVNSVVVDLDGAVWVGTSEGPVIFDYGSSVFDASNQGVRKIVLQDNIGAFLLADQNIRCMAVDGANNKWFGTDNGVFVQSPDGEQQLAHFTSSNSPLFDNQIQAMAFDGISGEMYIGTNKGLLSFRTNSVTGSDMHRASDIYAFPNPVRADYMGSIAIRGLVTDALVKITDINGVLVSEMKAQGGQAIWNGEDLGGRRVDTGIYLVWSTEPAALDAPDSYVTKIAIIR